MPVLSPHRSTSSGGYRSSYGSSMDRPYYTSNYPRISSYSERFTTRSYTDADGRRIFSRSGSITEDGVTTRFREESREGSVRRDSLCLRDSAASDTAAALDYPRRDSSLTRSERHPSASGVLDSVAELRNKYSPANYVPACLRAKEAAVSRSRSIGDIGLPPLSAAGDTSRSSASAARKKVNTDGLNCNNSTGVMVIANRTNNRRAAAADNDPHQEAVEDEEDDNGNRASVADLRRRFDEKTTAGQPQQRRSQSPQPVDAPRVSDNIFKKQDADAAVVCTRRSQVAGNVRNEQNGADARTKRTARSDAKPTESTAKNNSLRRNEAAGDKLSCLGSSSSLNDRFGGDKFGKDKLSSIGSSASLNDKLSGENFNNDKFGKDKLSSIGSSSSLNDKLSGDSEKLSNGKVGKNKLSSDRFSSETLSADKIGKDKLSKVCSPMSLSDDKFSKDKLSNDKIIKDKFGIEKLSNDKLGKDKLSNVGSSASLSDDKFSKDKLSNDKIGKDKFGIEKLSNDKFGKDKLSHIRSSAFLSDDKSSKDKLSKLSNDKKEEGKRDQTSSEREKISNQQDKISIQRDKESKDKSSKLSNDKKEESKRDQTSSEREKISNQQDKISIQRDKISGQVDKISSERDKTSSENDKINSDRDKITSEANKTINEMYKKLGNRDKTIACNDKLTGNRDKATSEGKDKTISIRNKTIVDKSKMLGEKDKTIGDSSKTLSEKDKTLSDKSKTPNQKDKTLGDKSKTPNQKDKTLGDRSKTPSEKDKTTSDKNMINNKDQRSKSGSARPVGDVAKPSLNGEVAVNGYGGLQNGLVDKVNGEVDEVDSKRHLDKSDDSDGEGVAYKISRVNNYASFYPVKGCQKGENALTNGEVSCVGGAADPADGPVEVNGLTDNDMGASPKLSRSTVSPSGSSGGSGSGAPGGGAALVRRSLEREQRERRNSYGKDEPLLYDKTDLRDRERSLLNNNNNNGSHHNQDRIYDKLYDRASPVKTLGLNGLKNIGNTCFMNSVIQCLSNTRPLLEYLRKDGHLRDINTTISGMKGALIRAFAEVIKELWSEDSCDRVVNTVSLKSQIQRFAPRFMGYAQQDAQEFLRYLLEGLHEDVNRVTEKPKPILTEIDEKLSDNEKSKESWSRYLRMDNSRIVDYFVGQLKSTLRCTHCGHASVTFDPFWDLSLPIPQRTGQLRLAQCLDSFTREETLDGDEKPTCSKCKERRKCTKSFAIQKFPKILVIHLKRFSPTERFRGKLSVTVDFPLEGLDMGNYAADGVGSARYNLYAVSNHSGTTYSGHYTAYCRHPYAHTWHEYNDSRVSSQSSKSVVSSEAYVLFYELEGQKFHL